MTKDKKPELSPCPFCGINNESIKNKTEYRYHDTWEISCGGCGTTLSICDYNRDITYYESDIIAAWNRRHLCDDHRCCCNTCDHKCGIELAQEDNK